MNDKVDLKNHLKTPMGIPSQSITGATVDGTGVNMQDTGSEIRCVINLGSVGSGAGGTVKLQESANNNTADEFAVADAYADITGASHTFVDTADNTVVTFTSNRRSEKFVRATVTTTGGTAVLIGVTFDAIKHKM